MATPLPLFLVQLTTSAALVGPVGKRITEKFGDRVVHDAKDFVPKDTRSLMRSIKKQKGRGLGASLSITAGGPSDPNDVDYAQYVELGTSGRPPSHFMRRAVNKNLPKYEKEMADVMALLHAGRPGRISGSIGR